MQANEAIPVLKMLKTIISCSYFPSEYGDAIDTAVEKLSEEQTEYREEMRL